ncbi:MAG: hypothetical protein ACLFUZ_04430 [Candidatus Micrarchaeia archaeon]
MHGKNPVSAKFRDGRHKIALSLIKDTNPGRILEVGCEEGYFLRMLSEKFPKSKLYGCDTDLNSIKIKAFAKT